MELWIRTQDRLELIKAKDIKIFDCEKQKEKYEKSLVRAITQEPYDRTGFEISSYGNVLGVYNSKERALEVLDEIQDILTPKMVYKNITEDKKGIEAINQYFNNNVHFNTSNDGDIHFINNTYVYQMPID